MSNIKIYEDLIAFHPGSYIKDIVEELNITQQEFAKRLDITPKLLSTIINGESNLSNEVAYKLSKLTGVSVGTWMNLQNNYDKKILEIKDAQEKDEDRICELIDIKYFKKYNFIEDRRYSFEEKKKVLRKILNVSSLTYLNEFNPSVSYRNTKKSFDEKTIVNANVMLEIASNQARNVTDKKLDTRILKDNLNQIKQLTLEDPNIFYKKLKFILLKAGVVLVGLPNLKNASINGATKKFKNGSVLLLISDKGKDSDRFWFSLLHEIGHIMAGDINSKYDENEYLQREERADNFARDFFIPPDKYQEFLDNTSFRSIEIKNFANELGILPGIVVGRLQNDKYIPYNRHNNLKTKYKINLV